MQKIIDGLKEKENKGKGMRMTIKVRVRKDGKEVKIQGGKERKGE